MKKTIEVKMNVGTHYVESTFSDIIEVDIDDSWSESKIEDEINEIHNDWVNENIESYWEIL